MVLVAPFAGLRCSRCVLGVVIESCVEGRGVMYLVTSCWFWPSLRYAALAVLTRLSHRQRTEGRLLSSLLRVILRQ